MAGKAAYKALIKSTSIAPVATIDEPLEPAPANLVIGAVTYFSYRVTDPLKRIMSISGGISTNVANVIFRVDWISGTIHFVTEPVGGVEADFEFFTASEVVGANSYSMDIGGDVLTDTSFSSARANGGFHTRILGLGDVSVSIDRFSDYGQIFLNYKRNRERVLVEITPGGEDCGPFGGTFRGWFIVETDGFAGDVGDLESESISFNLDGRFQDAFVFIPWEA